MVKRILITGKHSYIGNKLAEWLDQWPEVYQVDKVSLREVNWQEMDWHSFDVVVHVAGIAHNSSDPKLEDLYYQVNRDLTAEVGKKAKAEGVSQLVFMSSIIVYGSRFDQIDQTTPTQPDNFYGDSKLQAEQVLEKYASESFALTIVRPPMIYGPDSKGNYPLLAKFARISPLFPDYPNQRSMLYVDNLSEFLRLTIDSKLSGIFHPQNPDYVNTSQLVKLVSEAHGKRLWLTKLFNPLIHRLQTNKLIKKVFGSLIYNQDLSHMATELDYQLVSLEESVVLTEKAAKDAKKIE